MKDAALNETERLINPNCGVVWQHVEKGSHALLEDVVHHDGHESACVAAAARIRVCADRTDFNESGKTHTLAGHCEQTAGLEDAKECAEFAGAFAKWSRFRQ